MPYIPPSCLSTQGLYDCGPCLSPDSSILASCRISPISIQILPRVYHLIKKPTKQTVFYLELTALSVTTSVLCLSHSKTSRKNFTQSLSPLTLNPFSLEHTPSGFHFYHSSEITLQNHQIPHCWNCFLHDGLAASHPRPVSSSSKAPCFLWHTLFSSWAATLLTVSTLSSVDPPLLLDN